ncbi:MAG: arginine deiminase family protein, partial [Planctomycetota bacterium]
AAILDRNATLLANVELPSGRLNVVRIPMPPRESDFFGGTYTNVVYVNGILVVPTWPNAPTELEELALATFRKLLPGWEVVGIDASNVGAGNGGFRCMTMPIF